MEMQNFIDKQLHERAVMILKTKEQGNKDLLSESIKNSLN